MYRSLPSDKSFTRLKKIVFRVGQNPHEGFVLGRTLVAVFDLRLSFEKCTLKRKNYAL